MAEVESRIEVLQKLGIRGDALIGFGEGVSWGGMAARLPGQGTAGNADWLAEQGTRRLHVFDWWV
jgi:hypothetical protein